MARMQGNMESSREMSRLDGKVIVATGGTQGIGQAVALHAARSGAAGVVFCGRQEERGAAVVAEIERLGRRGRIRAGRPGVRRGLPPRNAMLRPAVRPSGRARECGGGHQTRRTG